MRFIAVFFLFCLLSAPAAEAACTCTPAPLAKRWEMADAVFTGRVTEINLLPKYVQAGGNDAPVRVTLQVEEAFKGAAEAGKSFDLHTSLTRDTCTGHPFETGRDYLVFGYMRREETKELWSFYNMPSGTYDVGGLCGGTRALDETAAPEIEQLKRLSLELPPPQEPPVEEEKSFWDRLFGD